MVSGGGWATLEGAAPTRPPAAWPWWPGCSFMSLDRQLLRWKEHNLVTNDQVERILAFEKHRPRPGFAFAVAALAAFAVALGLAAIVAANWDLVPGRMKLAIDLLAVVGIGQAVVAAHTRSPGWLGDATHLVFYGLILASIALVGQVYQLGGGLWQALLLWCVLTLPLMAMGSSPWLGFAWLTGLTITYFVGLAHVADGGPRRADHALAAVYWAPLATLGLGRAAWLRRLRPAYALVFRHAGWTLLVAMATVASFAFYDPLARGERAPWAVVGVSLAATAALCLDTRPTPAGRARRLLLALLFATSHLPLFVPHGTWPVAAAMSFISVFAVIAWVAHRKGLPKLLHLATAVIGVRLLAIYFEVFGSLLDTGLGLVIGGLLTLLVTWFWARKRREFDRELSARESLP
jgi:uncharacterized membrane protein